MSDSTVLVSLFKELIKTDSFSNVMSGLGTFKDRKMQNTISKSPRLTLGIRDNFYKESPIMANIINSVVDDSIRKLPILDHAKSDLIYSKLEDLNIYEWIERTWKTARKDGFAVLTLNINDGQPSDTPVNIDRIKDVSIGFILSKDYLSPLSYNAENPSVPLNYWIQGTIPEYYRVNHTQVNKIYHKSRLLMFSGKYCGEDNLLENDSFPESLIDLFKNPVLLYEAICSSVSTLSDSAISEVIKFADLTNKLGDNEDEEVLKKLITLIMGKSVANRLILDKDDEFEYHSATFTGYKDLEGISKTYLSSSTGYPQTKLFGTSPAGGIGSNTGSYEDDIWANIISVACGKELKPNLKKIILYIKPVLKIPKNDIIPIEFESLKPVNRVEEAEIRNKQADTDIKYLNEGVLTVEEIRQSRFSGKFNINTQLLANTNKNKELLKK